LVIHGLARGGEARARARAALEEAGLPNANDLLDEVPHRLSGGMRQRVAIAAALAARPRLVLADEPTTALDATIRASVFDLLDRLRRETEMAVLLVSHDRRAVERRASRVLRLERGRLAG
jgi:ABC-type glutathione transport system ATPase component